MRNVDLNNVRNKIFVNHKDMNRTGFSTKYRKKMRDPLFSSTTLNRDIVLRRFFAKKGRKIEADFLYTFSVYNKDKDKAYNITKQKFKFRGRIGKLARAKKEWTAEMVDEFEESNIEVVDFWITNRTRILNAQMWDVMGLSMNHIGALDIKGFIPAKTFQVNENECVMDYLLFCYKDLFKHLKVKRCDLYNTIRTDTDDGFNVNISKYGVNTYQLLQICQMYKIPLRAFDDKMGEICCYEPKNNYFYEKKTRKKIFITSLYYMVKNSHMYPLTKDHKRQQAAKGSGGNFEKPPKKPKPKTLICLETSETCSYDLLLKTMKAKNKEPDFISTAKEGHIKFGFDDEVFIPITKEDLQPFKDYCKKYDIEYNGQCSYSAFTPQFTDLVVKSSMNSQVSTIFNTYKRGQIHQGCVFDKITPEQIKNKKVVDLAKCHKNILLNPNNDWFRYTTLDKFERFNTEIHSIEGDEQIFENEYEGENGFYFITTKDTKLFSGDGLYTNKIIDVARKNKIKFVIHAICRPSYTIDKGIFKKPIEKFLEGDDTEDITILKKMVINNIAGCLGVDSITSKFLKANNDMKQVANNMYELELEYPERQIVCDKVQDYYLYGMKSKTHIINNNRPLYLQIIEQSNIKLFELQQKIEKAGGNVLFRYSDEIHYVGDYIPEDPSFTYKQTKFRDILNFAVEQPMEYNKGVLFKQIIMSETDWKIHPENNSDQHPVIIDKLLKSGGLILGMGGTGKSHIIHHLKKALDKIGKEYVVSAYTNVAARMIDGKTLHSMFNLKAHAKEIEQGFIKKKDIPEYVIIDEVSMLNTFMYSILDQIRLYHPDTKLVMCGDFHQIPPIQEEHLNFKNSFVLKQLTQGQKWGLDINHRQKEGEGAKKLIQLLKVMSLVGTELTTSDIREIIKDSVKKNNNLDDMVLGGWNIGRNKPEHKEGKRINKKLNDHHASICPDKIIDVPDCDFKVIRGMRVICKAMNNKIHPVAKNVILEVVGTKTDEDGTLIVLEDIMNKSSERIFLKKDIFVKYFDSLYMMTADKSQCQTFKGKVFIHQLNKLFCRDEPYNRGYVAFGRATSIDNIFLATI